MNYRNIIKSRELRVKILSFLGWIPDAIMLRLQYWLQTGRRLNLNNPKRFTEKLQIYKMKYRAPEMLRCTDKYEVRKYIEEKGFGKSDGGGGNQVFVCKEKSLLMESDFKERLNIWMSARKVKKILGANGLMRITILDV